MRAIQMTAFDMAQRFVGVREVPGSQSNPAVLAMLKLDDDWPEGDDVPWCSAFANYVAWLLRLPRSKSLMARSWLKVGRAVGGEAEPGFDVVVLKRGTGKQPGPEVLDAPGHVGFYAGEENGRVLVLGGNQKDEVNIAAYPKSRVLGIRRLY
ncbi:hypothetical protein BerOc1_00618 [Pseudodesulfovibrio hydrargyri]|uniref:TIGR02594 family protein n=1 Tax=Pseudodesulfovibrio hydrargyri TaxID=2125990 RepID=A0A1J5NKG5_9BACT|nr:TIGR02594 family protein [Pseudodesulfovibrio hydrargyri]OIQ52145.1 hypothetical protein BerOc1_00618 [Pseudodesulfovibrio hydrargyri]